MNEKKLHVLELFVTEVPREDIPDFARFFVQDKKDGKLKSSRYNHRPTNKGGWWYRGNMNLNDDSYGFYPVATDASETIVTREELMSAYDLVEQGYTLWFGGDPVPSMDVRVDYVCDNGFVGEHIAARMINWAPGEIIAYRLSKLAQPIIDKSILAHIEKSGSTTSRPKVNIC